MKNGMPLECEQHRTSRGGCEEHRSDVALFVPVAIPVFVGRGALRQSTDPQDINIVIQTAM